MLARFSISDMLAGPGGKDFLEGFYAKTYAKGVLVCTGNLDETGIFIVSQGKLRVFLIGDDHEITLFYLGVGDLFSMHSGCLIEACEPALLWVTDIATFQEKMVSCPAVSYNLVSILGRAMTSCIRTIQGLAFHDIRHRLVRFFLDCAESQGKRTPAGTEVRTPLTVEEISLLIGSGRQATSTAISCLIKEGYVIRLSRGHYIIPDIGKLRDATASTGKEAAGPVTDEHFAGGRARS